MFYRKKKWALIGIAALTLGIGTISISEKRLTKVSADTAKFTLDQKYNNWSLTDNQATYTAGISIYVEPKRNSANSSVYKKVSITKGTKVSSKIAKRVNNDVRKNLASSGLEPISNSPYTYKFNNMNQISIVNVRYYDKGNSATRDKSLNYNTPVIQANNYDPDAKNWEVDSHDESGFKINGAKLTNVEKNQNGKFTVNLRDLNIANKYKTGNYVFDIKGLTKSIDPAHANVLSVSNDGQSLTIDFNKVKNSSQLTNKKTSYEVFIKPKHQASVTLKNINSHSRDSIINWFNASKGPGNGQYIGTTILPNYSMGLGQRILAYKNNSNYKTIQVKSTGYKLALQNPNWKFENNASMNFLSINGSNASYNSDSVNLSKNYSIYRGWLKTDSMEHNANSSIIPSVTKTTGYTALNKIPYFAQYFGLNHKYYIYSFEGTLGKTYNLRNNKYLPIKKYKIYRSTLPKSYKFDFNNKKYKQLSTYLGHEKYKRILPQVYFK